MFTRQLLTSLLVALLAVSPCWASPGVVVGTAGPSQAASVRGAGLLPGTTLFSGDIVTVGSKGGAAISFGQGSMARLSEETTLRVTKGNASITVELGRGRVSFRSSEQLPVEAHLADAIVRPANGLLAVGRLAIRSVSSAVVTAEKGMLLVTTAHEAKGVTLREGESVEMRLEETQGGGDARAAGVSPPWTGKRFTVVAITIISAALIAGIVISAEENSLSNQQKQNLVSPFQFPPP